MGEARVRVRAMRTRERAFACPCDRVRGCARPYELATIALLPSGGGAESTIAVLSNESATVAFTQLAAGSLNRSAAHAHVNGTLLFSAVQSPARQATRAAVCGASDERFACVYALGVYALCVYALCVYALCVARRWRGAEAHGRDRVQRAAAARSVGSPTGHVSPPHGMLHVVCCMSSAACRLLHVVCCTLPAATCGACVRRLLHDEPRTGHVIQPHRELPRTCTATCVRACVRACVRLSAALRRAPVCDAAAYVGERQLSPCEYTIASAALASRAPGYCTPRRALERAAEMAPRPAGTRYK